MQDAGCRLWFSRCTVSGQSSTWDSDCRVQGAGFRVQSVPSSTTQVTSTLPPPPPSPASGPPPFGTAGPIVARRRAWVSWRARAGKGAPSAANRGGLVFKAHGRLYHSTLCSRMIKKREEESSSLNPRICTTAQRESSLLTRQPTGPNALNHRENVSRLALRHGSLNSLIQAALCLPS